MRTVFAFLMASLDGYHETADGDLSWHNVDSEFNEFAVEQLDEADTLLFGRRSYPIVLGAGHPVLAGAHRTRLALVRSREFRSGNVLLTYRNAA
jgi:hypothetical protein